MGVGEHSGSALWPKLRWDELVQAGRVQTSNVLMGTITGSWGLESWVGSLGLGKCHQCSVLSGDVIAASLFILQMFMSL